MDVFLDFLQKIVIVHFLYSVLYLIVSVQFWNDFYSKFLVLMFLEQTMSINFIQHFYSFDTLRIVSKYFISKFFKSSCPDGSTIIAQLHIEFVSWNSFLHIFITIKTSVARLCTSTTEWTAFIAPVFVCNQTDWESESGSYLLVLFNINNLTFKLFEILKILLDLDCPITILLFRKIFHFAPVYPSTLVLTVLVVV